jgi:hypothetical protein
MPPGVKDGVSSGHGIAHLSEALMFSLIWINAPLGLCSLLSHLG